MTVQAAGAVLWRRTPGGVEVAVVHRPKYDDWSLPKGKLDADEGALEAACREVEEETGQRATPGVPLGTITYPVWDRDGNAADKIVHYWAMEADGGQFEATEEVDELRWLAPGAAAALVTYERDREVLERFGTASVT